MRHEVTLPELGDEANEEAEVCLWTVQPGDKVEEGDDLLEVTTDKAAFTVPSPKAGRVVERCVNEGDHVIAGAVLCVLEV